MPRVVFVLLSFLLSSLSLSLVFAGCGEPLTPTLEVTPSALALVSGQSVQLTVTRRFSGGAVEDVTNKVSYTTSNKLVATVDPARGLVVAREDDGAVLIRVTDPSSDAVGVATVTVTLPRIQSIELSPAPAIAMKVRESRHFTAVATYTNGTTRDVTSNVLWSSTNEAAAVVGNGPNDKGLVLAVSPGDTTVLATDNETRVQGRSIVFVQGNAPQLKAIVVTPNPGIVSIGQSLQMGALGVFSDGSARDLTNDVKWSSTRTDLATVQNGLVAGVAAGSLTITASAPESTSTVAGSAALTVVP
jgi:trimeric autotransporter adhesin